MISPPCIGFATNYRTFTSEPNTTRASHPNHHKSQPPDTTTRIMNLKGAILKALPLSCLPNPLHRDEEAG